LYWNVKMRSQKWIFLRSTSHFPKSPKEKAKQKTTNKQKRWEKKKKLKNEKQKTKQTTKNNAKSLTADLENIM